LSVIVQLNQRLWLWLVKVLRRPAHRIAACCALILTLTPSFGQLAVPVLTAHVLDTTGTLQDEQRQQLEARLSAFEQSRGAQLVVLLVPTTQPEDIASYANRVANTWKIGRRDIGDGVLMVVAIKDRKIRIEVAKTLEGAIADLAAKRVISELITPRFKANDYAGGLEAGTDQLMKLIAGEALPAPVPADSGTENGGFQWIDLGIFVFVVVPLIAGFAHKIFGSRLGALATGAAAGGVAWLITSSLFIGVAATFIAFLLALFSNNPRRPGGHHRTDSWDSGTGGGWGGGSSDSGGFSSGGGGDFGGGGASGDW
jgi:uncharacterized protein